MEQTSLNIGTIGQKLETARQAKGVTVSEAGRSTKILSKFIEAMEGDDFGVLSAPVYAKSFIRMYAQYLGIDAQPLVDEYVEQHLPKTKRQLSDEVRQNLAKVDQVTLDVPPPAIHENKQVFGGVNHAIAQLSGNQGSIKNWIIASVGIFAVLLIFLAVKQCDSDDETAPAPAPSGAALTERQLLIDSTPDAYLVKPGTIEVDLK